jgi:hypothetical protein
VRRLCCPRAAYRPLCACAVRVGRFGRRSPLSTQAINFARSLGMLRRVNSAAASAAFNNIQPPTTANKVVMGVLLESR